MFLWYAIKKLGLEGFASRAQHSLRVAAYAEQRLNEIGVKAWRNPNAITVVFPSPSVEVCAKWQLATEKGYSHIICMPNVTLEQIDEFILDILNLKS
ncbi:hypothetical protein [Flavobacterium oreochromis]|uniref:hypothetical protein n=1 Tax=Flavobacterium oreochromis TaxID=2906078 RepID=UPI002164997E|nr:hypothetical protein [Flavobacterium oreochromis]